MPMPSADFNLLASTFFLSLEELKEPSTIKRERESKRVKIEDERAIQEIAIEPQKLKICMFTNNNYTHVS